VRLLPRQDIRWRTKGIGQLSSTHKHIQKQFEFQKTLTACSVSRSSYRSGALIKDGANVAPRVCCSTRRVRREWRAHSH
jgi:hypothetical protein